MSKSTKFTTANYRFKPANNPHGGTVFYVSEAAHPATDTAGLTYFEHAGTQFLAVQAPDNAAAVTLAKQEAKRRGARRLAYIPY